MIRKIFFLASFILVAFRGSASPETNLRIAIDRVNEIYTNFKHISEFSPEAPSARLDLLDDTGDRMFAYIGMPAPGDLVALGVCAPEKYDISVENYVNRLYDFCQSRKAQPISFDFIVNTKASHILEDVVGPQFKKGETEPHYAKVLVEKKFGGVSKPISIIDTLWIDTESRRVCNWTNRTTIKQEMDVNDVRETIESLKFSAAMAFNRKEYEKAYQLYERILTMQKNEQEASYKLAVMLYKKTGTPKMSKKDRDKRILELLDSAINGRDYIFRECASNMKYWLTC